jgi:hypothetical protein
VFIVVRIYFVIDSVWKLLDTPSFVIIFMYLNVLEQNISKYKQVLFLTFDSDYSMLPSKYCRNMFTIQHTVNKSVHHSKSHLRSKQDIK